MPSGNELIIIAESKAKPGKAAELRAALLSMLTPSRAEPGCVLYTLHEDRADPGHFWFYEIWKDQAAFDFHAQTDHYKMLGPEIAPLQEGSIPLRHLKVIG
jgi:quinol monooxygenase YgiN